MIVDIYWIDKIGFGRIGTMARPRGGDWLEDEIKSLDFSEVNVVVSLLEREETVELDIVEEEKCCIAKDISFFSFPIIDRDVPISINETLIFTQKLSDLLSNGKNIVVHCRQGIGRASLITACVLVLSKLTVKQAFEKIENARGCKIPDTQEQYDWVKRFAEQI